MLVSDVMQRALVVAGPEASLVTAARDMRGQDVGCLPVLESGRLIGMITDRDIVTRGVAEGLDPMRTTVREVMSETAIACSLDQSIDDARDLMESHGIKHLPVLDREGRVAGLVTLRDITGQFARCRPHQVTFYKRLPDSSGQVRNVEVAKVYLSTAIRKDEVLPVALARFERDRGLARWDQAADCYEIQEAAEGGARPEPPPRSGHG